MDTATTIALLLATGVAAGVLSALMGIGGGLVMVPALHYGWDIPWHEATALSLLAITIQVPIGVWRHHRRAAVDWRLSAPLAAGGLAGVFVGDALRPFVPVPFLRLLFAAVLAYAAWRMLRPSWTHTRLQASAAAVAAVGVVAGILAAWLGIGGGIVTVPVLVLGGTTPLVAIGTSLVPVWTNAVVATGLNAAGGLLSLPGLWLGVGAMAGAVAGVRIAHWLPERGLRLVLAIGLICAALAMAVTTLASPMDP